MSENNEIKEPLNKNYKVPKLRFKDFFNDWSSCKLLDIAESIKRKNDGKNWPLMMISASQGFINQSDRYDKDNAGTSKSKYTLIKYGELSYNHGNSKIKKYGAVFAMNNKGALIPFVYHTFSIRKPNNPFYFAKYLNLNIHNRYLKKVISSGARMDGLLNISLDDFFKMPINYPSLEEQNKINDFLEKIDTKINLINDKISILKKYKEGFTKRLAKALNTDEIALSSICSITTGKMDANAMNQQGKYKFFTCSREDYFIDTYAFDCEALLISGNGEVGLTKYYNGKFNAYQRTYVLYNLKRNAKFIKLFIDLQINTIIRKETNKGAMPYIRLTTFNKITIPNIDPSLEYLISIAIDKIDKKIELLQNHARVLNNIKNNLLSSLFI